MPAIQRSVYLSERTQEALRAGDTLSGRINQAIDRYLEIKRLMANDVRALFSDADWKALGIYAEDLARQLPKGKFVDAIVAIPRMLRDGKFSPSLREKIVALTPVQAFLMLELLEDELANLATSSSTDEEYDG